MIKDNSAPPLLHTFFISLGSNIDPEINLVKAVLLLKKSVRIEACSNVWENAPFKTTGPDFLNAMIKISTYLDAKSLKSIVLREVEANLSRVRTEDKFAPRTIDLDIVLYDDQLVDPNLWTQAYLAVPFAELYPSYAHPLNLEPIQSIAAKLAGQNPMRVRLDILLCL
jgi:2-amino-4-hydroxy-6-hydroxymethyldihydropteridine diphosphokinase